MKLSITINVDGPAFKPDGIDFDCPQSGCYNEVINLLKEAIHLSGLMFLRNTAPDKDGPAPDYDLLDRYGNCVGAIQLIEREVMSDGKYTRQ